MTLEERQARIEALLAQLVMECRALRQDIAEEVKRKTQTVPLVLPELPNEHDALTKTQPLEAKRRK